MQAKHLSLIAVLGFAIAACGNSDLERGLTGAAAGAVTAKVVGADPVVGAAIGGAAGALCDNAGVAGCR